MVGLCEILTNIFLLVVTVSTVDGKTSVSRCSDVLKCSVENRKIDRCIGLNFHSNETSLNLTAKFLVSPKVFVGGLKLLKENVHVKIENDGTNLNYSIQFNHKYFNPLIESIIFNDRLICENVSGKTSAKLIKQSLHACLNHLTHIDNDGSIIEKINISIDPSIFANDRNIRSEDDPLKKSSDNTTTFIRRYQKRSLPENCGVSLSQNSLIVGGETAQPGSWPWLAAIYMKNDWDIYFRCSATIISDRHVITVGLCVASVKAEELLLKLGVYDIRDWIDTNVMHRDAKVLYLHPGYSQRFENNLAIVSFDQIKFTRRLAPICLWDSNVDLDKIVDKDGTVVGWGVDEDGDVTPEANQIKMPIVSREKCRKTSPFQASNTFCAGARDGRGPCSKDYGDGFYYFNNGRWRIRGIVSYISQKDGDCNLKEYVHMVDVARYKKWITEVVG